MDLRAHCTLSVTRALDVILASMRKVASVLLLSMVCLAQSATVGPAVAPELRLTDTDGAVHDLTEFRGKPVVLNFWATWCAPCAVEMPWLVDAHKKNPGVAFIAVSLDDKTTAAYIPKYRKTMNMKMPVWLGGTDADLTRFGVGPAMPSTVFIDEKGAIVGRVIGQLKKKDLEARLAWFNGDRNLPAPPALVDNSGKKN